MDSTRGLDGPPDPSRTGGTRVAHPRSEFIVPTAEAGGDAVPIHDTTTATTTGRMFPPAASPPYIPDLRQRDKVILGLLGPDDTAEIHQPDKTPTAPVVETRPLIASRRQRRWFPWSILVGLVGIGLVRLAAIVSDTPDGLVTTVVLLATAFCGILLMIAQLLDGSAK